MASVDVVIVSYRSAATLRGCAEPLCALPDVSVTVVDNASPDDTLAAVADLPVEVVRSPRNGGFSYGCNLGAKRGEAPLLLFLNPDARIGEAALYRLWQTLADHPAAALAGPRIREPDGDARVEPAALPEAALHVRPGALPAPPRPAIRMVRRADPRPLGLRAPRRPEWVSGACMLVRRDAFEAIGGFDEHFFLYCEDTDLCRRLTDAGHEIRFEPAAEVRHVGGASSDTGATQRSPRAARVLYARKHMGPAAARVQAAGVALGEVTHALAALPRPASRRGHMAALRAVVGRARPSRTYAAARPPGAPCSARSRRCATAVQVNTSARRLAAAPRRAAVAGSESCRMAMSSESSSPGSTTSPPRPIR